MNTYAARSGPSSTVQSLADLDGYTFPSSTDFYTSSSSYLSPEHNEFGFDPPTKAEYPTIETYSPARGQDAGMLAGWPGFEREDDERLQVQLQAGMLPSPLPQDLPKPSTAVSRFGQVTPPRSNSVDSVDMLKGEETVSPKSSPKGRQKKAKQASSTSIDPKPSRKRKSSRKSDVKAEDANSGEDDKRKMSLEKNRLAAAKCRVNKKDKTEALQRDSHDKAVQNAFLKETVVRMKEEIQHINALLIAHASSEGCKRPDELHKHLSQVGQDYFSHHHFGMEGQAYSTYASLARQMQQSTASGFQMPRSAPPDPTLLNNPPLPEFNQSADFDVRTPQPEG